MSKRIIRVLGVLVMGLALLMGPLAGESVAQSQPYPPGGQRCRINVTQNRNILRIRVVCPRLGIRINIRIILRSTPMDLGEFATDEQGNLDATVTVPESVEPGSHHLQLFQSGNSATGVPAPSQVLAGQQVVGAPLESIPLTVRGSGEERSVLVGSTTGNGTQSASPASRTSGSGSTSTAPLTAAAIGLVAIGAGGALMARRRRNAPDAPNL